MKMDHSSSLLICALRRWDVCMPDRYPWDSLYPAFFPFPFILPNLYSLPSLICPYGLKSLPSFILDFFPSSPSLLFFQYFISTLTPNSCLFIALQTSSLISYLLYSPSPEQFCTKEVVIPITVFMANSHTQLNTVRGKSI